MANAPQIVDREDALRRIERFWLPAVRSYSFEKVRHKSSVKQDAARELRQRVLVALGEKALRDGGIRVAAPARQLAEDLRINPSTANKHLREEAARCYFIRVVRRGEANPAGGWANVYKLLVDAFTPSDYDPHNAKA